MKASDAMDPDPVTLKPTDSIQCAADFIMDRRFRSLPVVDENDCYMGMFGVNCLLKQVLPKAVFLPHGLENFDFIHESYEDLYQRFNEVKNQPISICMNQDTQPIEPDAPLTKTLLQLYQTRAAIPVVEPGSCKLLGVISYWDIGEKILAAGKIKDA